MRVWPYVLLLAAHNFAVLRCLDAVLTLAQAEPSEVAALAQPQPSEVRAVMNRDPEALKKHDPQSLAAR